MSRFIGKSIINGRFVSSKRTSIVCSAVTNGVVPPDVIPVSFVGIEKQQKVVKLASSFDDANFSLAKVPAKSDPTYAAVVEKESEAVWLYASKQYDSKCINKLEGFTVPTKDLFNVDTYLPKGYIGSFKYTVALSGCKKIFARGALAIFWDAIGIKVQNLREFEQRIGDAIGLTQVDYGEIKENLDYVGKGFAFSARTTQSADYILNKSKAQKIEDQKAFNEWYKNKLDTRVKILRLNVSDIPLGYAFKEIVAFEKDPKDAANIKALEAKLLALQKEAYQEWDKAKKAGNVNTFILEEWLAKK